MRTDDEFPATTASCGDRDGDDRALRAYLEHHLQGAAVAQALALTLRDDQAVPALARLYLARFQGELREEMTYLRCTLSRLSSKGVIDLGIGLVEGVTRRVARRVPKLQRPTPFEGLEMLAIGVWGKRLLWRSLQQLDRFDDRNRDIPFPLLVKQALDQERALVAFRDDMMRHSLYAEPVGRSGMRELDVS